MDIHDGQSTRTPFNGRIEKRKAYKLQIIISGWPVLQK
jgi:hypothetical protein